MSVSCERARRAHARLLPTPSICHSADNQQQPKVDPQSLLHTPFSSSAHTSSPSSPSLVRVCGERRYSSSQDHVPPLPSVRTSRATPEHPSSAPQLVVRRSPPPLMDQATRRQRRGGEEPLPILQTVVRLPHSPYRVTRRDKFPGWQQAKGPSSPTRLVGDGGASAESGGSSQSTSRNAALLLFQTLHR